MHRPAASITRTPARRTALLVTLALSLLAAPALHAQTWNEVGDAGDLPATAQPTIGSGALTTLNGSLASPGDVDVYCIQAGDMVRVPGYPVVNLLCTATMSPNVWVFDANGIGVSTNETCAGGFKTLTTNTLVPFATYYVAVSYYGLNPFSSSGAVWLPAVAGERTPDGPGAAAAVLGWSGTPVLQGPNPYQLSFNFMGFCDGPTPVTKPSWGSLKIRYGD